MFHQSIADNFRLCKNAGKEFLEYLRWLAAREIAYYRVRPREALFFLTYRCTARCQMCRMWTRPQDYEEMDLAAWQRAVDIVAQQKVKIIYLFGGDVLLKKDILFPLARYIKEKDMVCDITTNGYLLDAEAAKRLIDSGADNIGVSIDAVGPLHNRIRRVAGMFERATAGLRELVRYRGNRRQPTICAYCTVSNLNIDSFEQVVPYVQGLGVDHLHIEYIGEFSPAAVKETVVDGIVPNPYYERQADSLLLAASQAEYFKNKIEALEQSNGGKIHLDTDNIDCLQKSDLVKGEYHHKRCYMARYHINVDPSGNIIPCLFFQHYHLGNIRELPFDRIWNNGRHRKFLTALAEGQIKICRNCIVGVQRNPTMPQAVMRKALDYGRKFRRRYFRREHR